VNTGPIDAARILLVDDTPDVRTMLRFLLEGPGLSFEEAESGEEALARCGAGVFDLIVLDHRMPGLTGIEVAKTLRADRYVAPIVMYSAYVTPELTSEANSLDIPVIDKADHDGLHQVVQATVA
jgi:CheY-like chemotaxis protein